MLGNVGLISHERAQLARRPKAPHTLKAELPPDTLYELTHRTIETCRTQTLTVKKGLLSAAQHRRRGRPLTLTVHNVTTARDLVPPRQGETRRRTSHRHLASHNIRTIERLNAAPGGHVTVRVDWTCTPCRPRVARSGAHVGCSRTGRTRPLDGAAAALTVARTRGVAMPLSWSWSHQPQGRA